MSHEKHTHTELDYRLRTMSNASRAAHVRNLAKALADDPRKAERLAAQQCRLCFYQTHMAGQAFTPWNCAACGQEGSHHNTAVPLLCKPCGELRGCCVRCGGDMCDQVRRDPWPTSSDEAPDKPA